MEPAEQQAAGPGAVPMSARRGDPRALRGLRARRRRLTVGLAAVAVAAVAGALAWRAGRAGPGAERLNVVLITLDTTRADHLGCYGHPEAKTPHIDRLAAEGTRFAECVSAAPSTLPAHATILTALTPPAHGVRDNIGFRLAPAYRTLAEVLRDAGLRTAAFVAAAVLNRPGGLDQGFEVYEDVGRGHERPGNEVCDSAAAWLRAHAAERFFLWVHFFDPHFPYEPPLRFRQAAGHPYQGEIAFADEQVGRLLEELRTLGIEGRTLVVLTADHGEGLGEHGEETHLYFVYDTTLRVPLIFRCPGVVRAGRIVAEQVRTIDIAPTILGLLGLAPAAALPDGQGADLAEVVRGRRSPPGLPAYGEALGAQLVFGIAPLRCLRADGWKYIHAPRPELYRFSADPGERMDLAAAEPQRCAELRERLRELVAEAADRALGADGALRADPATLSQLESLGYVGAARPRLSGADELERFDPVGDDPKDHLEAVALLGRATHYEQTRQHAAAEDLHRRLCERFPGSVDLGMRLGRSLFLQGRLEDALALYERLAAEHADSADVHYGLAKLLSRLERRPEAIEHFARAAELDPQYPEAHYDLGVALMKEGRRGEALECFRRALRARPTYVDARVNLGAGLAAAGRLDEAIAEYRAALAIAPDAADIHYNLGNALLRQDRPREAAAAYAEALRLRPEFAPAREALRAAERRAQEGAGR